MGSAHPVRGTSAPVIYIIPRAISDCVLMRSSDAKLVSFASAHVRRTGGIAPPFMIEARVSRRMSPCQ